MKKKFPKLLFAISFIPYILIIVLTFFEYQRLVMQMNDFETFKLMVVILFYTLIFYIPLVPVCFIFQIFYILRRKVKKFKDIELKKYIKVCSISGIVFIIIWTFCSHLWMI